MANCYTNGIYTFEVLLPLLYVICLHICLMVYVDGQQSGNIILQLPEELPKDHLIGDIANKSGIKDKYPEEIRKQLKYSFLSPAADTTLLFYVDENAGLLKTASRIDRDKICPGQLRCIKTLDIAVKPGSYFQVIPVRIEIIDLNDNTPTFSEDSISIVVPESTPTDKVIALLPLADDPDSGLYGIKNYNLLNPNNQPSDVFQLRENTALDGSTEQQLILKKKLDRESKSLYQLKLYAFDGDTPHPKSGVLLVNITVQDTNDNKPVFEESIYETDVPENTSIQTVILKVSAYDYDIGANGKIVFGFTSRTNQIDGNVFGINQTTGEIFLKKSLDFESKTSYRLVVTAKDQGAETQTAQMVCIVRVTDINDFIPEINIETLTSSGNAEIHENKQRNTFVAHVTVVDHDSEERGKVTCGLNRTDFRLNPLGTDEIKSKYKFKVVSDMAFDRELKANYTIGLTCRDSGTPPLSSSKTLNVIILDTNDHDPVFPRSKYTRKLEENNPLYEHIMRVTATDADEGKNGEVNYSLSSDDALINDWFEVVRTSGDIRAKGILDHEKHGSVVFHIVATDKGEPTRSSTTEIELIIMDINDNKPVFKENSYSMAIYENELPGTSVGNVIAEDEDMYPHNIIRYKFEPDNKMFSALENFKINRQTGYISSKHTLDREAEPYYYFKVVAYNVDKNNTAVNKMSSSASVTIYVSDLNDNSPVIDFPSPFNFTVLVPINAPKSFVVTRIRAHDKDFAENGKLSFGILKGDKKMFHVHNITGAVSLNAGLSSKKEIKQYNLTIIVQDHGISRNDMPLKRNTTTTLRIIVAAAATGIFTSPPKTISGSQDYNDALSAEEESPNFTIVIAVACGSTVVIVSLIVAIILLSCRGRERRKPEQGQYNCRVEAQRMLNGKLDRPTDTHESSSAPSTPSITYSLGHPVTTQDEGYLVLNHDDSGRGISLMEYTPENTVTGKPVLAKTWPQQKSETQVAGLTPSDQGDFSPRSPMTDKTSIDSAQPRLSVCNSCVVTDNDRFATKLVPLTDKEIEIHKILKFLHSQQDDHGHDGQCSDSMSTSDSGKGASVTEESEIPVYSSKPNNKQVTFFNLPKTPDNASGKNMPSHLQPVKSGQMSTFSANSPHVGVRNGIGGSKSPTSVDHTSIIAPKRRYGDSSSNSYPSDNDKRHNSPYLYNNKDSSQNKGTHAPKKQLDQFHNNSGYKNRRSHAQKQDSLPLASFKNPSGDKSIMQEKTMDDEDNISLNDNLSDVDTASTISGSYVLVQDDNVVRVDLNRLRDTVV